MSTRGFVGFIVDGKEKIAYNHFNSYPSGLGMDVMQWAERANLQTAREQVAALQVVTGEQPPTQRDIERLSPYMDDDLAQPPDPPDWSTLLLGTQGDPAKILDCGYIKDASDFPINSLFAEWGYLVNLDIGKIEVYRGVQDTPHHESRFASRPPAGNGYWPVKLVATFPLDKPDYTALLALEDL